MVTVGTAGKATDLIRQHVIMVKKSEKIRKLQELLHDLGHKKAIVFSNKKGTVHDVTKALSGYRVTTLHGDKSQEQREISLNGFRTGRFNVLVATDVAGRGRAGKTGTATAFLTLDETNVFYDLKQMLMQSNSPVPPEIARHEASKFKPGSIPDRPPRPNQKGVEDFTDCTKLSEHYHCWLFNSQAKQAIHSCSPPTKDVYILISLEDRLHQTCHPNPQHHLLVQYKLNNLETCTSIIDNNTFPQQKFPLTTPESLRLVRGAVTLGSDNGLLCYFGYHNDTQKGEPLMAVIWNRIVRKSVAIATPKTLYRLKIVGFGVCPRTSDPKLVRISVVKEPSMWVVEVSIDGVIYWRAYDDIELDDGLRSNFIISFDFKSDKFGEVCLPERLVYSHCWLVANMNESLVLLEYNDEGGMPVCGVWMRKDGENKPCTKIYTVKVEGRSVYNVLGFRKNGEVVLELGDYNNEETEIEVYEPSSGRINSVRIIGSCATFCLMSQTLSSIHKNDGAILQGVEIKLLSHQVIILAKGTCSVKPWPSN
uniref:DEAD-box ATP-dependent RNA helicase 21 n=1 Tax=Tanacetum cinerariifolium TaxID=118510 RepID=A0A699IRM9_TANCI|nr:DEAD-box ATP-dependent RNA helicase 21 [Tanacetum cinerariifolium]